jgi:DeoR/GlpR family transcriptional regulator of sugar metabolism
MSNSDHRDLAAGRLEKIERMLIQRRIVRVDELCADIGVSPATIRRDLRHMERDGKVRRVHGGAMHVNGRMEEPLFDDKAALAAPEKNRIARKALAFVKPTDSVFLDGGSTVLAMAALLADMPELTVVTNSLRVAGTLSGTGPRTIVVGGELRRRSQTFVGPMTRALLEQIHVDTAFMGTIGLSVNEGMTTTDSREAYTKGLVLDHAGQVILLADSSKLGKVSFVKFGSPDQIDVLVTDSGAPARRLTPFRRKGIKVLAA